MPNNEAILLIMASPSLHADEIIHHVSKSAFARTTRRSQHICVPELLTDTLQVSIHLLDRASETDLHEEETAALMPLALCYTVSAQLT